VAFITVFFYSYVSYNLFIWFLDGAGVTPPNLIDDCRNIDDGICSRLAAIKPGFCHNDTCVASKLCPRMCGQCCK